MPIPPRERRSEHARDPFLLRPRRRPFTAGSGMNGRWVLLLLAAIAALAALAWFMDRRAARDTAPAGRTLSAAVAGRRAGPAA
jgi:hypothetical protein